MPAKKPTKKTTAERLKALGANALANLLADLMKSSDTVVERVQLVLASGDPDALVETLRRRIQSLWEDFEPRGSSSDCETEMDAILDDIARHVLADFPEDALELLSEFICRDKAVFENVPHSGVMEGMSFGRAADLWAQAGRKTGDPERCLRMFLGLLEHDEYGVRGDLLEHVGRFLRKKQIEQFLALRWQQVEEASGESGRAHALFEIKEVAEATHNPKLYERAALWGSQREAEPILMLKVAAQYLACKDAAAARERLPSESVTPEHWRSERRRLALAIRRQLGGAK